jgi:hypothetical protein
MKFFPTLDRGKRVLKTEVLTAFNTLLAEIRTQVWFPAIGSGDAHQ